VRACAPVRSGAVWCALVRRRIGQNDDQVNWLQDAAGSDGVKARGFVDMQIVMSLSKHARGIGRDWRQGGRRRTPDVATFPRERARRRLGCTRAVDADTARPRRGQRLHHDGTDFWLQPPTDHHHACHVRFFVDTT